MSCEYGALGETEPRIDAKSVYSRQFLASEILRRSTYSHFGLAPRTAAAPRMAGRGEHARHHHRVHAASRPLQPIRKDLVIRFRRQRLAREAIMAAKEISVKKYVVRLSGEERERLETLLRKGKSPARRV